MAEFSYPSVQATNPALHSGWFRSRERAIQAPRRVHGGLAFSERPFRAKGVAEAVAAAALSDLNKLANELYMASGYLKRKLGEWCREAQRPARKQAVVDADEPAPAADDPEEETEAEATSGLGAGGGLVIY